MLTSKKKAKIGDQVLVFGPDRGIGSTTKVESVETGALRDAPDHIAENDGQFVGVGVTQVPLALFDALTTEQREELWVDAWAEWPAKTA